MQTCFALVLQDNAVLAFRSPRVRASAPRRSLYGRVFLAFKVSRRIPISTFGHSNACRQSRRADCGLSHVCLRSSAACAFCGVLCVLDGFVMKCPKVETMCLDGAEIPGSVNFGGARSQLYGATGPFLWCAESVLAVLGIVVLCLPRSDNHIYPRGGRRSNFLAGERRANMIVGSEQKRRPEGRLACKHANKFPRRGRRVCDASALRSGPPCRT